MSGRNILIVEDDFIIQLFIKKIVASEGLNVIGEARSCDKTMAIIGEEKPDLILMDIGIEGDKDGVDTATLVKESYEIPIIYITGNSDQTTLERAKNTDPLDIIFKPISEQKLRNKLQEVFSDT